MKMTWKNYVEKAIVTSTHNSREKRITCCLLGLNGEVNELFEHRDNIMKIENIKKEFGDIFWYLAVLCYELNYEPKHLKKHIFLLTIPSHIAQLHELMKKDYRDYDWQIHERYRDRIFNKIDYIYTWLIEIIEKENCWRVEEIWQMNIDKLYSRMDRNQIKGEGDER